MTLERDTLLHKRYRIIEILGQGGMGSVYRAVDENLGVDVAVKENLFTTEEYARQFRLEAVILANLRHPNLPRVSDHFVVGEQGQYLVMDFIEGEDLRQRMERDGTISEEDAMQIGAAMCDALEYLHTRKPPILHRDIKPGNVKITPDGHIYLVDFGLAKVVQGTQATTTGARAMTPGYSPPEQYGTARTDPRTDVYSLGATLYAALCGAIPEDGLARAMDNAQLTPLRKRNSKISRRLAAAIEKAMAVDPADRFQTAEDFKRALVGSNPKTQRPAGNYTVTPPPINFVAMKERSEASTDADALRSDTPGSSKDDQPFVSPRKKQQERERRIWQGIFRFLLIIIVLGGISIPFIAPDLLPARWRAAIPFLAPTATSTPTSTQTPSITPSPTVTVTPLTATVTYTATNIPSPVVTETLSAPTETPTPAISPTLAPTQMGGGYGQISFAYILNNGHVPEVYLSDLRGQNFTQLTNMPGGACQPSWAPDGTRFVFTSPCQGADDLFGDSSLYIINADGTGLTPIPTVPGGDFDPVWAPDGKRIAFTSQRSGKMEIYVYNLGDQSVVQLTSSPADVDARQAAWSPDGTQIVYSLRRFGVSQIWMMTANGSDQTQIVRSGTQFSDYLPTWSPDGKLILFNERAANTFSQPYIMSISGVDRTSEQGRRLQLGFLPIEHVQYSPDGFWVVFEGDNHDILYMTVTGANRVILTSVKGVTFDPAWRPISK